MPSIVGRQLGARGRAELVAFLRERHDHRRSLQLPLINGGAVGVKPVAVTLPLTVPSSLIVTDPLPAPLLLTAGTSSSPDSLTSIFPANAAADVQPSTTANDHADSFTTLFEFKNAFIALPLCRWNGNPGRFAITAGARKTAGILISRLGVNTASVRRIPTAWRRKSQCTTPSRRASRRSPLQSTRCPGGETGRRKGLKIPRPQGHTGSSPVPGTKVATAKAANRRHPLLFPSVNDNT